MVSFNNLIKLQITEIDIKNALSKAMQQKFIDNLRYRPKTVQLDCKIRGYLGEIALKNWFANNQIYFDKTNYVPDGFEMDIDLAYNANGRIYNIEIKTSLVPDSYLTLENSLKRCDIKLIKRTPKVEDLKADIHIQIYFDFLRKQRDTFLSNQLPEWENSESVYNAFNLESYINNTYFVAWIDKPTLLKQINSVPESQRTWTFMNAQKDFWKCNIQQNAKNPNDIIQYIKLL